MRFGIVVVLSAFLFVSAGCGRQGDAAKPTKKETPPVVQDMNIVKPESGSDDK